MDFQQIIDITDEAGVIKIGCIMGSGKVLYIKTGQDGTIYGYETRYLNLAQMINETYGCTVFVSATTIDSKEIYDKEMQIADQLLRNVPYEIYYMGISKGGLIGCWYGTENPKLKKIVSINAPLMLNFHNKTSPAIKKYAHDQLTMVYGTLDPSYRYIKFIDTYASVKIVHGADHQFRNHPEMFEALACELLWV